MPNYFAPAFRIDVNNSEVTADVSSHIQELSVVSKPNTLDHFTFTLANAYPELRWTHDKKYTDLFMEGATVQIQLGYVDQMEIMIEGEITSLSPTFPEDGMPSIAVEGYTRFHWLEGTKKTRTFQHVTDKQIVEKIAQDAGLQAHAEDPGVSYDYVMQHNQTDLEFIRARAQRIHFEVLVEEKTLIFRKGKQAENKIYTLVWGHPHAASDDDKLPLKSFSPTLDTKGQASEVFVRGYDPKSKQEIIGHAGPGDESKQMGGKQTGGQVVSNALRKPKQFVRVSTPIATQQEADAHARAIYNDKVMNLVKGNASTIGIPGLRAGSIVEFEGLGHRFSGKYYVSEATHTIGGNGYQTDFSVQRNAVG